MTQTNIDIAIARVICRILRDKRPKDSENDKKFYFLDLQPECIAHAVTLVAQDPVLASITEIHLARKVFSSAGLAAAILTDDAVGDFRNQELETGRRLMFLGPPDVAREWETIRYMNRLDGTCIMNAASSWVAEFAPNIVDDQNRIWWTKALEGLNELRFAELHQYADYVLRTAQELNAGIPLTEALGKCLPSLRLPRHLSLFTINANVKGQKSQWQRKFNDHKRKTKCYLEKKDKSDVFLDKEALQAALEAYETNPDHEAGLAALLRDYVTADYGWTATSERIAEVDWPVFNAALIEPIARERTRNLGADTRKLFQEGNTLPDLTEEQQEYLDELTAARTKSEPTEDDRKFFKTYYRQLQASPAIFSRWEAFIMEKSIEDEDFFRGLARCIQALRPRSLGKRWRLVVAAKAATKDLLQVYEQAAIAFATRYRGIHSVLANSVDFQHFDDVLNYPSLLPEWKNDRTKSTKLKGQRPSKAACQITFYVNISTDKDRKVKLIWRFNPKSVYANFRQDLERLTRASSRIACTEVVRETSGRRPIPTDLSDTRSLQPAFGRISGTLIPQADNLRPFLLAPKFAEELSFLEREHHISAEQARNYGAAFSTFESDYALALAAFLEKGLGAVSEIEKSAAAYGALLQLAASASLPDIAQATLLPIILSASTVDVRSFGPSSQPTAIVPPWHPLRLLAILTKARQFGALVDQIATSSYALSDADGDLLFEDVQEWLSHIYYPEIVCRVQALQPRLLAICDTHGDYSVHEPPVKDAGTNTPTDSDPRDAAVQIARIVGYYLSLQPHERDNLSVVLFDCDSDLLPEAVVEQIRKQNEDDEQDATCQILLAHSDKTKLRALYRTLTRREEAPDAFNSSEATRDFMARLRINIMVAENAQEVVRGGHPYDIVFAENAIARRAQLKWEEVEMDAADALSVKPSAWSRRRPMRSGPVTSAVYLTSPRAPAPVWDYIRAISHAIEPDQARNTSPSRCLVPCRVLGLHDEKVGALISRMHDLGSWVVNYDELLHRKLLSQKDIRIIRYKQESTQGKNLIISSKAKVEMLRNELGHLTSKFQPDLDKDAVSRITSDLIAEANSISGNLVLRAVRRRENAKELFGLVLSKHIVSTVLTGNRRLGWFLLDDYAQWLGEDEKQIADIFCLSPAYDEKGSPILDLVITEAKFVDHSIVDKKAKESASQLRQSLQRLESGLNPDNRSLDREIWLARISDLIVDGMEMPGSDGFDAATWRCTVRDGGCAISIRGFSHVFDSGPELGQDDVLSCPLTNTRNGVQEVYSLTATKKVLASFVQRAPAPRPAECPTSASRRLVVPGDQPVAAIFRDPPPQASAESSDAHPGDAARAGEAQCTPASDQRPASSLDGSIVAALGAPSADATDVDEIERWKESTTKACRKALLGYEMSAELIAVPILTPNSVLLRFKGTDTLTVDALQKKSGEMRTTHALDVIGIRSELGAVTVVISRPKRQKIFISQIWHRWQPTITPGGNNRIVVAVKEDDNQLLHLSPVPLPHTLVAGMTGSGKSVLLQNIILGIAASNTPEVAKIAIIDPKCSAQLRHFERLPHMLCPIVNGQKPSLTLLASLCNEMDARNRRLSEADVSDIDEYIQSGHYDMPRIWVIYDEYGDWIRSSEKYKEEALQLLDRLAMKSRSSGIYLVLAAQRPDNTLFSMVLRSNLGNRLALLVADEGTSAVATGVRGLGADRLLGSGHLLAKTGELKAPVYAQVPFVSPDEVRHVVKYISESLPPAPAQRGRPPA